MEKGNQPSNRVSFSWRQHNSCLFLSYTLKQSLLLFQFSLEQPANRAPMSWKVLLQMMLYGVLSPFSSSHITLCFCPPQPHTSVGGWGGKGLKCVSHPQPIHSFWAERQASYEGTHANHTESSNRVSANWQLSSVRSQAARDELVTPQTEQPARTRPCQNCPVGSQVCEA